MPPLTDEQKTTCARLYTQEGYTLHRLRVITGAGIETIRRALAQQGVCMRNRGHRGVPAVPKERKKRTRAGDVSKETRQALLSFYTQGMSLTQLGKLYHMPPSTCRALIIMEGGKMRVAHMGGGVSERSAHIMVNIAVREGSLVRQPCEICHRGPYDKRNKLMVVAHHDDYNYPLKVRWLCHTHHREWHQSNEPIAATYAPEENPSE
jgi:hypothetical protein